MLGTDAQFAPSPDAEARGEGFEEIGGYRIESIPRPGETYIALAPGQRRVVLKMLEPDCLSGWQLHPNIRDRLGRVREAATLSLANLLGAECDGSLAFLVWQYVEGLPLQDFPLPSSVADFTGAAVDSSVEVLLLAREILLAVHSLHALGLVHGALHERNIFVCRAKAGRRQIILTHVSPFLYSDPAEDVAAIIKTLTALIARHRLAHSPLGRLLSRPETPSAPLDWLIAQLTDLIDGQRAPLTSPGAAGQTEEQKTQGASITPQAKLERRRRRRSILKVLLAALAGVAAFISVQRILKP